jgi:hypothetical protein
MRPSCCEILTEEPDLAGTRFENVTLEGALGTPINADNAVWGVTPSGSTICATATRRCCCTRVNVKVVSGKLDHASAAMTLDRYSHVVAEGQEQAVAALDAILGGGWGSTRSG